jgi:transposase InsO family protein
MSRSWVESPTAGGWRLHGRCEKARGRTVHGRGLGYDYLHVAIDDHTRLAYVEALPDERDTRRAVCVALGIRRRFTKPSCPWTNGKAERFNRTPLTEFAYATPGCPTSSGSPPSTTGSSTTTLDAPTPPSGHPTRRPTVNNVPGPHS